MKEVIYEKGVLGGKVEIPPSKSCAHRAVLCGALAQGESIVENLDFSRDIRATLEAVKALGAQVEEQGSTVVLSRGTAVPSKAVLHCEESGSTLRFLIPIAAALGVNATFVGSGRLPQRPLGVYEELLPAHGVEVHTQGGLPLEIRGKLRGGVYRVPGNISSQFITGLLLALPLGEEDSTIILTSPLESKSYVDLTVGLLKEYGIQVEERKEGWHIPGNQQFLPRRCPVEGDWSQAAFYLAMAACDPLGGRVEITGLSPDSLQGDKACCQLFRQFGLSVEWEGAVLVAQNHQASLPYGGLQGITLDATQIPDMVPALSVCAACAKGVTEIVGAQRLRLKECDRLEAMAANIQAVGGQAEVTPEGLRITGRPSLQGGLCRGYNDHRVVMALAACALRCEAPLRVDDAHSIEKSYPGFYRDYTQIGGVAHVVDVG